MKRFAICSAFLLVCTLPLAAQNNDVKFIADTLVVQADGTYEADPDLATLTFDISSQDKELKPALRERLASHAENRGARSEE